MKKIVISLAIVLVSVMGWAQSQDKNYIKNTSFQVPVQNEADIEALIEYHKMENINYFDGLGRPEQNIVLRVSGNEGSASQANALVNDWELGSFTTPFYQRIGQDSENNILMGTTPFNTNDLLWECGNDSASDADGGWNTVFQGVDNTQAYRYTVWVKRSGDVQNGRVYHGTKNVNNLDGTPNPNPYFFANYLPQADTWYLMVGVIHPYDYVGADTGVSGIYDQQGTKVLDGVEYKWDASTTVSRFRNYLYYSTDVNVRQYFWNPLLQVLDNDAYTLAEIISLQETTSYTKTKDIVTPVVYDSYGRQTKEYLPYAKAVNGKFTRTDVLLPELNNYYTNAYETDLNATAPNPYADRAIEASPLQRILEQGAPGKDWSVNFASDSDHTIKFGYETNTTNEVRYFKVAFPSGNTEEPQLVANGFYAEQQLYKSVTKDENWQPGQIHENDHTTEEFKNKQGQVILKRTYNEGLVHDTQYVYDDFGNLTYVLSPKGSDGVLDVNNEVQQAVLDELCYQYRYDSRNRLIGKKIPGKGWEYIVYDKLNRPVLTQDANLSETYHWLFTKYDSLNRIVYTGKHYYYKVEKGADEYRMELQGILDAETTLNEAKSYAASVTIGDMNLHHTNDAYPRFNSEVYTVNYYDDYSQDINSQIPHPGVFVLNGQSYEITGNTRSLPTGSRVRVLGTNQWITSVSYYDEKARPIYAGTKNDYLGTKDIAKTALDFVGKALRTESTHEKDGTTITTRDAFAYDQAGRLLRQEQQIDDHPSELIAKNEYDVLGQLSQKRVGGAQPGLSTYVNTVGVTINGNTVQKTTGTYTWDAGFSTQETISGDGYVSYTLPQDNKYMMVSLSYEDLGVWYTDLNYAMYHNTAGNVTIYENGVNKGLVTTYVANDHFAIERRGQVVYYLKNDEVIYISDVPTSNAPLIADVAMYYDGGIIKDLVLVDLDNALQDVGYDYNIRGWLTEINDAENLGSDLFGFRLNYSNPVTQGSTPLYNGNISETLWRTNNTSNDMRGYGYDYDALNRIKGAKFIVHLFGTYAFTPQEFRVSSIDYDKNGNLLRLDRRGHYGGPSSPVEFIDRLFYTYDDGNKLMEVLDSQTSLPADDGFIDGNKVGADYSYDANGNMIEDKNKDISSIMYNHLNLPTRITVDGQGDIRYAYDATGIKQAKSVTEGSNTVTTKYAGNFIYEQNGTGESLKFFNHPEGYIEPIVTSSAVEMSYVYQYKDHLGNIRLSYTDSDGNGVIDPTTEIVEENNYYPFGLEHKGYNNVITSTNPAQNYKYNGKELNEELGLDWYDYGARNYEAALGRWMNIDPLASKYDAYSPFSYAFNSPTYFIDPDGRRIIGASGEDSDKVVEDVHKIFADSKFDDFRKLVKRDKGFLGIGKSRKLAKIDASDLAGALDGVQLSESEQALVDTVVNTINSGDKHKIEFAKAGDNLSSGALNVFKDDITAMSINIQTQTEKTGGVPVKAVNSQGGSVTKETNNGTYSLVVEGGSSPSDYFNTQTNARAASPGGRELSTGHELFGHGRSLALGRGIANQHIDGIQMENLIIRVMGHGNIQRDGTDHQTDVRIPNARQIPDYR
ncbi:DUF6443 domain-containing protein [Aureisphaera galaxeae]|uniref:DUF6443 domain-containing protein n=1 Tax=Aureisphaera galaxeae TaxID=1538023 RepID=UPI0023506092|nr:DUF6443 domain-containing protein [Aureisphaera galaxeae]MDC8006367.1 DUF6443 domain-containing protein [Aureisphaera galaxeae]